MWWKISDSFAHGVSIEPHGHLGKVLSTGTRGYPQAKADRESLEGAASVPPQVRQNKMYVGDSFSAF